MFTDYTNTLMGTDPIRTLGDLPFAILTFPDEEEMSPELYGPFENEQELYKWFSKFDQNKRKINCLITATSKP